MCPLTAVGKPLTRGVSLFPAIRGEWRWQTDSELRFTPRGDWPVGRRFKVTLDREMFPGHVHLDKYVDSFVTATW